MDNPKCYVKGVLHGGKAICGSIITGGEYCGKPRGNCDLQERSVQTRAPASRHSAAANAETTGLATDMQEDHFARQPYGKAALKKIGAVAENFRIFEVATQIKGLSRAVALVCA